MPLTTRSTHFGPRQSNSNSHDVQSKLPPRYQYYSYCARVDRSWLVTFAVEKARQRCHRLCEIFCDSGLSQSEALGDFAPGEPLNSTKENHFAISLRKS